MLILSYNKHSVLVLVFLVHFNSRNTEYHVVITSTGKLEVLILSFKTDFCRLDFLSLVSSLTPFEKLEGKLRFSNGKLN
jgi:hypothetical protein